MRVSLQSSFKQIRNWQECTLLLISTFESLAEEFEVEPQNYWYLIIELAKFAKTYNRENGYNVPQSFQTALHKFEFKLFLVQKKARESLKI